MSVCSLSYTGCKAHAPYCHLPCFPTLYHNCHDFRVKVVERKMCALIFSTVLPEAFIILKIIQQVLSQMSEVRNVKYSLFLLDFNET